MCIWAGIYGITHDFAVDLDGAVCAELFCLERTAGEHGAEDGNVQPPLKGGESHLHVGRHLPNGTGKHLGLRISFE